MIKKILLLFIFIIPTLLLAKNTKKHLGSNIELIFLQHAGTGTIITNPRQPQCYRLTLANIDERVIYISDAPVRVTGSYSIPEFVTVWHHNEDIEKIKPNVIVQAKNKHQNWINISAIFSNLNYDKKNNTLIYTLCPLDDSKKLVQGSLEAISLFIDPFHPWPP